MKNSAFLRRFLLLAYGAILLFAALIMTIYSILSPQIFAQEKINDLISKGQIIEQGNHQQLLAQHGRYYDLYTLQYSKQQLQNS